MSIGLGIREGKASPGISLTAPWPAALLRLGLLWGLALLAAWPELRQLTGTWAGSTTYTYAFLVPPLSAWLAWRERTWLPRAVPAPSASAALLLLGAGTLLLLGRAAEVAVAGNLALVAMVAASVPAALGWAIAWRLRFPILFLFTSVPLADPLVPALQDLTADLAVPLLRWAGIPVFRDGVLLLTPTGVFEVAEACAGLRFLIANIVLGLLFAHLSFRSRVRQAGFVALCLAVPVLANAARAAGIVAIAHWTDMRHAVGADHIVYGWGFFAAILLVLLLLGHWMADRPAPEPATTAPPAPSAAVKPLALPLAVAALLAGPAYGWAVLPLPATLPALPQALPAPAAEWQTVSPGPWRPAFPQADRIWLESFRAPDGTVDRAVAGFALERPGAEMVHHDHRAWDEAAWTRLGSGAVALAGPGLPAQAALHRLVGRDGQPRLVLEWFIVDGRAVGTPWQAKLHGLAARLSGRHPPAARVALSTDAADGPGPALARLTRFARQDTTLQALETR